MHRARKALICLAALATAASVTMVGPAPAVNAATAVCDGGDVVAPGVCELVFTSGGANFWPSSPGVTKIEAILVGAGGSGYRRPVLDSNGYATAGGGGEVKLVDFSAATRELQLVVADQQGGDTLVTDGTITAIALSGQDATDHDAGASGSGHGGYNSLLTVIKGGGGAGGSPDTAAQSGPGVVVEDLASVDSLFSGDNRCFGGGGASGGTEYGQPVVPYDSDNCGGGGPDAFNLDELSLPRPNSGGGGGGIQGPVAEELAQGANGVVIIRWNTTAEIAVGFDTAGHGTAPASQNILVGESATQPTDPAAPGYRFLGWYDSAGTTPIDFGAPVTAPFTATAKWAPVCTLDYNAGAGTGTGSDEADCGASVVLSDGSGFTRPHYIPGGWNTQSDERGIAYPLGGSYTLGSSSAGPSATTLFVEWDPMIYLIHYDVNGGSGTVPTASISGDIAPIALAAGPARAGYTFQAWTKDPPGVGTRYFAGESFSELADVTFYAQWAPITYSIQYQANGGTGAQPASSYTAGGLPAVLATGANLVRNGYSFTGWNTAPDGSGTSFPSGGSYSQFGNATLYAQWVAHTVDAAFSADEGQPVTGSSITVAGSGIPTGSSWDVTVFSTPVTLGTGVIGAGSSFTMSAALPALTPGLHRIVTTTVTNGSTSTQTVFFWVHLNGTRGGVTTNSAVAAGWSFAALASTGASVAPVMAIGLSALLSGCFLLWYRRREPTAPR